MVRIVQVNKRTGLETTLPGSYPSEVEAQAAIHARAKSIVKMPQDKRPTFRIVPA